MNKYQYAMGLPGYGVQGISGSDGLLGFSFFVTDLDGIANTFELKNKILSNENLIFLDTSKIPGYPQRTYQNGDLFIDKNSTVFVLDFTNPNLYRSTGVSFSNTSFFTTGITEPALGFQRYYNLPTVGAGKLIDIVFASNPPLNYAQSIAEIYGLGSEDYNSIQYTGNSLTTNGINPFGVWVGNVDPIAPSDTNSIALVRETANNTWHFGNLNNLTSNTQRVNILQLDFATLKVNSTTLTFPNATTAYFPNAKIGIGAIPSTYNLEVRGGYYGGGDTTFDFDYANLGLPAILSRVGLGATTIGNTYIPPWSMIGAAFVSSKTGDNFDNIGIFGFGESTGGGLSAGGLFGANDTGAGTAVGIYIKGVTSASGPTYGIYVDPSINNIFGGSVTINNGINVKDVSVSNSLRVSNEYVSNIYGTWAALGRLETPLAGIDLIQMPNYFTSAAPFWTIQYDSEYGQLEFLKEDSAYVIELQQNGAAIFYGDLTVLGITLLDNTTAGQIVTTNAVTGYIQSEAKGTAWNASFGTAAGTIPGIAAAGLGLSLPVIISTGGELQTENVADFRTRIDVDKAFVDRGDPTTNDFTKTSAFDTSWHTLDLSSIISDATAKFVILRTGILNTSGTTTLKIRKLGSSNEINVGAVTGNISDWTYSDMTISLNSRQVEWKVTNTNVFGIIITVAGWF